MYWWLYTPFRNEKVYDMIIKENIIGTTNMDDSEKILKKVIINWNPKSTTLKFLLKAISFTKIKPTFSTRIICDCAYSIKIDTTEKYYDAWKIIHSLNLRSDNLDTFQTIDVSLHKTTINHLLTHIEVMTFCMGGFSYTHPHTYEDNETYFKRKNEQLKTMILQFDHQSFEILLILLHLYRKLISLYPEIMHECLSTTAQERVNAIIEIEQDNLLPFKFNSADVVPKNKGLPLELPLGYLMENHVQWSI